MFSKFNFKQLAIIFGILLAIVLLVKVLDNTNDNSRSFKKQLVDVEDDQIESITLSPRSNTSRPYTFTKDGDNWIIEQDAKFYNAAPDVVTGMLRILKEMKVERIAANNKDKWAEYEVTDSTGTLVVIKNKKGKELVGLYCGKFSYTQPKTQNPNPYSGQQGKMTSFVRLNNEKEVYAVDGYVSMAFDRDLKYMRNPSILSGSQQNWSKVTVNHPGDSAFVLTKEGSLWKMNGLPTDSTSTVAYLSAIQNLSSTEFYDETVNASPTHSILIEGKGSDYPIEIKGYYQDGKSLISSSLNSNTFFDGKSNDVFKKLFQSRPVLK